jgi:hypothetical protein
LDISPASERKQRGAALLLEKERGHARNVVTAAVSPHFVFVACSAVLASERRGTVQAQHCVRDSAVMIHCLGVPCCFFADLQAS